MNRILILTAVFYAGLAQACPGLTQDSHLPSEVIVGCKRVPDGSQKGALQADKSVPAAVNQRDYSTGGECRVETENGDQFFVEDLNLVLISTDGSKKVVGILESEPRCINSDDDDWAQWTAVTINDPK